MLPRDFRIIIINETGVTLEFTTDSVNNTLLITGVPWKLDADGAISFRAEQNIFTDGADLTDTSSQEGSAYDNATNLDMGMHCTAILTTDAVTAGPVEVYIEYSTDDATTFPSDSPDFQADEDLIHVASLPTASANEDRAINFEL